MPVSACARTLRCADNAWCRQIDAHVSLARAKQSYAQTRVIGIDETSCAIGAGRLQVSQHSFKQGLKTLIDRSQVGGVGATVKQVHAQPLFQRADVAAEDRLAVV